MFLERPSDDWPAPDDRPRTPWLLIKEHGEPVHAGAYEVAHYPYFKDPKKYPEHFHGRGQVQLLLWSKGGGPFFRSLPDDPHTCSLHGYCGSTWYRGLANRADSDLKWSRDDQVLVDLFEMVGDRVLTLDIVKGWSDDQCQQAEDWAFALHFSASDNDVVVPPTPPHVQALALFPFFV